MNRITYTEGTDLKKAQREYHHFDEVCSYFTLDTRFSKFYFIQFEDGEFYINKGSQELRTKFLFEIIDFGAEFDRNPEHFK